MLASAVLFEPGSDAADRIAEGSCATRVRPEDDLLTQSTDGVDGKA